MDLEHMNSLGVRSEIEEMSFETDAAMSRLSLAYVIKGAPLTPEEVFRATGYRHAATVGLFAILAARAGQSSEDPTWTLITDRLGLSAGIQAILGDATEQGRMTFRFVSASDQAGV